MVEQNEEKVLFSWVHLSDIHFLHGNQSHQIDQEMILQALVREFRAMTSKPFLSLPKPDALFVTGDVAFSGGEKKIDEYILAEKWLLELINALSLSHHEVFVVPGNHDIQRSISLGDDDISMLLEYLRENRRDLDWALSNKRQRGRLASRLENYFRFCSKFAMGHMDKSNETPQLFWQRILQTASGFRVGLLGLNTALLSQDSSDKGKLRLSLSQLKEFPDLTDDPNQLSIALSHHPLFWLADGQAVEGWLRKKVHIHLCGHIHDAESMAYRSGGGTGLIRIQAGALHRDSGSEGGPNCFNFAAVVANNRGQIFVRVWNRIWSEKNKDFRDDPECHPPDKPYAEHQLQVQYISHPTYRSKTITLPDETSIASKFVRESKFITDSPPVVDVWVGRESELSVANRFQSGVIAVTGIGGQGKSAFASKYLGIWSRANPSCFWDWRDCREQREQFHTKLVSIIENVSSGRILGNILEGAETKELIRIFFEIASNFKGMIILDNMDHYVDVSTGKFTIGVASFVESALQHGHNLTILITCRPRINYASPRFQEIHLKGISVNETVDLFKLRGLRSDEEDSVAKIVRIHTLTEGHPLWLNLIGTQIANKLATFEEIIADLEHGGVDDRAITMMRTIWKGLTHKQEVILRHMAELSKPQEADWIHDCVRTEIKSWSTFWNSFLGLKNLNLVIESRGTQDQKEFDLHPIVRNFIRTEFCSRKEREPILTRVIYVVDTFISRFAKSISIITPINILDYWILKAELALRKEDFETATKALESIGEEFVLRGVPGELFRVGELLLEQCEGKHERLIDLEEFHDLNYLLGQTYAEYGRREDAQRHLERYSRLVPRNTAHFIGVCKTGCYVEWFLGNFNQAISWGKEGFHIKKDSNIDTKFDTEYNLALALRDSGKINEDSDKVNDALKIFLKGATIESVLAEKIKDTKRDAPFFGNIGRCLQFQGLTNQALQCFVKSAIILEKKEDLSSTLNKGYACLWIGEVLEAKSDYSTAYIFYRRAESIWLKRAPLKADEPRKRLSDISEKVRESDVLRMTEIGIERAIKQWIAKFDFN